jgi:hypothetical protein
LRLRDVGVTWRSVVSVREVSQLLDVARPPNQIALHLVASGLA